MAAAMAREAEERGKGRGVSGYLSGFDAFARRVTSALLENEMAPAPLATVGGLDHVMEGRNR